MGALQAAYPHQNWHRWEFTWDSNSNLYQFQNGNHRGFKVKTESPSVAGVQNRYYYSTNWPSGSRISPDTPYGDPPELTRVGMTARESAYFYAGGYYWAQALVERSTAYTVGYPVEAYLTAATDSVHASYSYACNDLFTWAYCLASDYQQYLVRAGEFYVVTNQDNWVPYVRNKLQNSAIENTWEPWYANNPGMNAAVYCDGTGFQSSCYYEMNRGAVSYASVRQDVSLPISAGEKLTGTIMIRCRPGSDCLIDFGMWGMFGPAGHERRSVVWTIPGDNQWWSCRVGYEDDIAFQYAHDWTRFELYHYGDGNIDFDVTSLGYASNYGGGLPELPTNNVPRCAEWWAGNV